MKQQSFPALKWVFNSQTLFIECIRIAYWNKRMGSVVNAKKANHNKFCGLRRLFKNKTKKFSCTHSSVWLLLLLSHNHYFRSISIKLNIQFILSSGRHQFYCIQTAQYTKRNWMLNAYYVFISLIDLSNHQTISHLEWNQFSSLLTWQSQIAMGMRRYWELSTETIITTAWKNCNVHQYHQQQQWAEGRQARNHEEPIRRNSTLPAINNNTSCFVCVFILIKQMVAHPSITDIDNKYFPSIYADNVSLFGAQPLHSFCIHSLLQISSS